MTIEEFTASLAETVPPPGLSPILEGLWQEGKGNWSESHAIAQAKEGTKAFDLLHAYLHRREGDTFNARYWYKRAGAEVFEGSSEAEWKQMVADNLKQ